MQIIVPENVSMRFFVRKRVYQMRNLIHPHVAKPKTLAVFVLPYGNGAFSQRHRIMCLYRIYLLNRIL